ncbi:hypothetical protein ACS0TY_015626 [Phlomoides rotata]
MFGAVIVNGLWGNERIECSVVNVNTTCPLNESEALWDIIHSVIVQNASSCCCIAGDFNSVRWESERDGRRGGSSRRRDINVFDDFFRNSGLIDLPLYERSYMWYKPDRSCWSRLDKISVSNQWMSRWSNSQQKGIHRSLSDHCPILLEIDLEIGDPNHSDSSILGFLIRTLKNL